MLRWCAFVVGVCLSAPGLARADSPAEQAPLTAAKQAEFDSFVVMGKRAQLVGRYEEAATAYRAALDIQPHPVIAGRYGLVLMKLGHLDKAAEELHEAHERGQGVALHERREVAGAYDKAKALTTWVNVNVSHMGAKVTCDGEEWSREGFSSFWRFAMPGEHTLRATLDGYNEVVETFIAKPGDELTISLKFVPLVGSNLPELPTPVAAAPSETRVFPPMHRTSNIVGDSNYDPKEDPSYGEPKETKPVPKKSGPRFSVNGGVVTVFGVASWNPAIGAVVGVGLRPNDYFSLGLEGRVAWLTTPVADLTAISAMTAGGIMSACGHLRWFVGCGLGYVGTVNVTASKVTFHEETHSFVQPGFGARLGAEIPIGSTFVARANIDAMRLMYRIKIGVGNMVIVDQPPAMFGAQIAGEWKF
ncbi:MAG TPA: tetratricopeptide repeat protein [Polyangium sp.]|nr:tetratricopeptide repeat protein [Polyangium sp.]